MSLPIAVLFAVPFALFDALLAIWLRGLSNDVYFQIGLVTLIALAAKNAILIVEFATTQSAQGVSAENAAINAARLRFRPIVMTSLAFILGVVPLAISSGAGAASRHSIGTGVIGGMLAATFIAQSYFDLRSLDLQLDIAPGTLASREEAFRLVTKRFEGGVVSELDLRQAIPSRYNGRWRKARRPSPR